jgi:beta-lactamase superfamily II metal-dependent hydrolase
MTTVTLLDVGHGNCTIVCAGTATVVIDSPTEGLLLHTLEDMKINRIAAAIISHADKDHIAGIIPLLTSNTVQVERVYVNPDGQKRTKIWHAFRVAVAEAELKGSCEVVTSLSTTTPGIIEVGEATITVVSPSAALALTGVGGETPGGQTVTANTLSGVLRVDSRGAGNGVLLAGDMDEISLDYAIAAGAKLSANVLVFPHHGGLPGSADPTAFAMKLLDAVKPQSVIFSNARGRYDNPRPEIVGPARERGCAIACTQLSERCHANTVDAADHLEPIRAHGKHAGACCAGSVTLTLGPTAVRVPGADERHQRFITDKVATPMCRAMPSGEAADGQAA